MAITSRDVRDAFSVTEDLDIFEGENAASSALRAPVAGLAFLQSATPLVGTATSAIRRNKRVSAAKERREEIWKNAQDTPFHKGALRYLSEVKGLTPSEIRQLLLDEQDWQDNQRNRRPDRIAAADFTPIYKEADASTYIPVDSVTLPSGQTIFRDDPKRANIFTNDEFKDSPWQTAIKDYRDFYRRKAEESDPLTRRQIESALNGYERATNAIIDVNRDSAYSMENPIIRTHVEYVEAVKAAEKEGLNFKDAIENERDLLAEGMWEIAKTAIGQGQPIPGMEGENYVERAQYMGEMVGFQGLLGMFTGIAARPVETAKYKPNLPVMMMMPLLFRYLKGNGGPQTNSLFEGAMKKNPRFANVVTNLKGQLLKAGKKAEDVLPGLSTAAEKARRIKADFRELGEKTVGFERKPMKMVKGDETFIEALKEGKNLRDALDAVMPGELAPVKLKTAVRNTVQSLAMGWLLGLEFEAGAASLARRAYQAIRLTPKGRQMADYVRKNMSRSEGVKSTQEYARIKEAAEALNRLSADELADFQKELLRELGLVDELRKLEEDDPSTPYEAVAGDEAVVPEGADRIEVTERGRGFETGKGEVVGRDVDVPEVTADDVIVTLDKEPKQKTGESAEFKEFEERIAREAEERQKQEAEQETKPIQEQVSEPVSEPPPAPPPKGGSVEDVPYTFEVKPGVEIPYVAKENVPAVSSVFRDTVRKAIRKVTGKAPNKAQRKAIADGESQSAIMGGVSDALMGDGDPAMAQMQREFFREEMQNRMEGSTVRGEPIPPKKLEVIRLLQERFGKNLGQLYDSDFRNEWQQKNKGKRFNPTEEVLNSVTDEGAIIEGSSLAQLTEGRRTFAQGRGRQIERSLPKEKERGDRDAVQKAAEVDRSGRQQMTDPDFDQVQVDLRKTEREFEAEQKRRSEREQEVFDESRIEFKERNKKAQERKESLKAEPMSMLREVAEYLDDGTIVDEKGNRVKTKGIRKKDELVDALSQDPSSVRIINKFKELKEKIQGLKERKKGRAENNRRKDLYRLSKNIMRSNLPQKMKSRLLEEIQPNAKESPFYTMPRKKGAKGKPYKSLGSQNPDYPYKNLIEEIEAAKKGEYAAESIMGSAKGDALSDAKKDVKESLASIVRDAKDPENPVTPEKAVAMILDSIKQLREDISLWDQKGPTPRGGTRGERRTVTPKDGKPFVIEYVKPSYFGAMIRNRLAAIDRFIKENKSDFDSGRSRFNKKSLENAAKRELNAILSMAEAEASRQLKALSKLKGSPVKRVMDAVKQQSAGTPQKSLSPKARKLINDIREGVKLDQKEVDSLPPLEKFAVEDLANSKPKSLGEEVGADRPATPKEIKEVKDTPSKNEEFLNIEIENDKPVVKDSQPKILEFVDVVPEGQPEPIVVGRPTTKDAPAPIEFRDVVTSPKTTARFRQALDRVSEVLMSDRVGMTRNEVNAFRAGVFQVLKNDSASMLMSETMRARIIQSYIEEAKAMTTKGGKKVFNDTDIANLETALGTWVNQFASPFYAPEGPAPWMQKEANAYATMLDVLRQTPGNASVRLDKRRVVHFENIRNKVQQEMRKAQKEGELGGLSAEAGLQAVNNIKGRAMSKAFGRVIQRDLDRRGVTTDMTPAEAVAALAVRELIYKEGRSYGLPNVLNVDGAIKAVTPDTLIEAGFANPKAFIDAAENLLERKLSREEMSDLIGVRDERFDKRKKESRRVNSESPVGEFLNRLKEYKRLSEKPENFEYDTNLYKDLESELPPAERELIARERLEIEEKRKANKEASDLPLPETAYLKDAYIEPAWHESMSWNAGLRKAINDFQENIVGQAYGQVKRGATMLSFKTSMANNLSHFVNIALNTGENPAQIAARFGGTLVDMAVAINWKDLSPEARMAYREKYPGRIENMQAAIDMKLFDTTMARAELGQLAKNRGYNLWAYGDLREFLYGAGDALPKTSEFVRQREIVKQKMKDHEVGETVLLKTGPYTYMKLRKNKEGRWEKLSGRDKLEQLSSKELDKLISVAAKLETDILIPDYNLVPRALKQARAGVGGTGFKQFLSASAGLTSPYLSYPYLMMDGPNKPGWLTRTFLSRSYDGPIISSNKGVKLREVASETATATRVALLFGAMALQYEKPETKAGRKATRFSGQVGGDMPAYVFRDKDGALRVVPLSNLFSGSSPELAWSTIGYSLIQAGDVLRNMFTGKGLLKRDYEKLSPADKVKYDALADIYKNGGFATFGLKRGLEVFAITGSQFAEATRTIWTQQNEYGQDLTGGEVFLEVAKKLGAPLVPGGVDMFKAASTAAAIASEATDSNLFRANSGASTYRNLIKSEELKREREFGDWPPAERMEFLIENMFAAATNVYARRIDLGLRQAMVEGKLEAREPKILKDYYKSFEDSYLGAIDAEILKATGKEKEKLRNFKAQVAEPAFANVKLRYDEYLKNLKEYLLGQASDYNFSESKKYLELSRQAKKLAKEEERRLIRERAAGDFGRRAIED